MGYTRTNDDTLSLPLEAVGLAPVDLRLDVLARIGQAIETAATLDELLLLSLYEVTQGFQAGWGAVALLNDENTIQVMCEYPPQIIPPPTIAVDDVPAVLRALHKRESLQADLPDTDDHPMYALLRARGVKTLLAVPLIAQDSAMGMLVICATEQTRRFSQAETVLARVLAGQIATAIASLRLHEAAHRRNEELTTLNEIASAITSTLDTHEVYRMVVQKLSAYFHVEAGSLLLIHEPTGNLEFVMTIEGGEEKLAGVQVPMGQGVVGHVIQTRHWTIVHDVETDPRFYRKVSEDLGFITKSILCVPMIAKGRVIGAIELLNKHDGPFEEDEAERLMRMAAFIGVAIENAHLFQQVADGRDRLAAILDSTADGILMTDMHGIVLTANPMSAQIIGVDEQSLIGRALDDVLETLSARAQEVVSRPWGNGDHTGDGDAPVFVSEFTFGQAPHRFSRLLMLPVRDANDVIYGRLAVLRNITQEKELEQLREDYTSMLVHDLRAPLTSIMNGIMMVQRQLVGPVNDQQQELLKIAYQGSTTMLALINNLLDISKMEQGSLVLDLKPLAPYAIIDRAIERLQVSAHSQHVRIEQQLSAHLPLMEADDEMIVRVLQNLLDNAIKFSPNGAAVTLGVDFSGAHHPLPQEVPLKLPIDEGNWLIFWIQDRGRGIPPAYHKRIFEKFGQVRGQKVRGTGLGLTFCKLAIEAHSGRIWVESEEGQGSVFAFALPLTR